MAEHRSISGTVHTFRGSVNVVLTQRAFIAAAAVLLTPELDLTESGDSFQTNMGVDTILTASLMPANVLYENGHDLTDPVRALDREIRHFVDAHWQ
jgi:hypothetical protein